MKLISQDGKYLYEVKIKMREGDFITGTFKANKSNTQAVAKEWTKRFIKKNKSEWLEFETPIENEKIIMFIAKKEIQSIRIQLKG